MKWTAGWITAMALALCAVASVGAEAEETVVYVAPDGDDAHPGTEDEPLAGLQAARETVRALLAEDDAQSIEVRLADGVYRIEEPLEFALEDSPAEGHTVTWTAAPGAEPILSGGQRITGWEPAEDGLWRAELPEVAGGDWYFRDLFVRSPEAAQFERRYRPSRGLFVVAGLTDAPREDPDGPPTHRNSQREFYFHEGDIEQWENFDDVELVVLHDWSAGRMTIEEIDFDQQIVRLTDYPHYRIGHWYPDERNPYLVENIKEDLGEPGEWYLDRSAGALYYHPLEGEDMDALDAVAPRQERLMRISGDAEEQEFVERLHFRGLTFAHTSWETAPHRYAERHGRRCQQGFVSMPSAIEVEWARDCVFERNTMAHLGSYAIRLGEGCHDNHIVGNRIFDCGTGGVMVGVFDQASEPPVTPTGNRVESNLVSDTGLVHYSGHGIWAGIAADTAVRHNTVRRTLYSPVSVGWSWNEDETACRDNLIEYNHIHDGMLLLDHGGMIYTLGYQPGTVLRGNLIHDAHRTMLHGPIERPEWTGAALKLDDGSKGFLLEENIFYDTPSPPDLYEEYPGLVSGTADPEDELFTFRNNYYGIAPGDEGFPEELADPAGPEPSYKDILERPAEAPTPPILEMTMPD